MMRRMLLVLIAGLLLNACASASTNAPAQDTTNVAKVKVTADGRVYLNGFETTLGGLRQEFERLATVNGEVWYYREDAESDPPRIVQDVLDAIIEAGLPVQFSETDFT